MATSGVQQRCFLLELPAEIRVLIYEELARQQPAGLRLFIAQYIDYAISETSRHLALAGVNHQIRQESIPVLYRNIEIRISTSKNAYGLVSPALPWTERVDPAILGAVQTFIFETGVGCRCGCMVALEMSNIERPVQIGANDRCPSSKTKMYRKLAGPQVDKLEVVGGERRVMTKEVLGRILRSLDTVSALC
jgi:hypothetical protein